jgi:hypothetical protein
VLFIKYHQGDQIKDEVGEACSAHGDTGVHTTLGGEPEVKRPLETSKCVRENNIKINIWKLVQKVVWPSFMLLRAGTIGGLL